MFIAEYGLGNNVSTYGDVYSYGILLLEMFIGKRPTDNIFQDNLNLHDFVKVVLLEQIINIINPILLRVHEREGETRTNNITHDEGQNWSVTSQQCLIMISKLGLLVQLNFQEKGWTWVLL